MPFIGASTALVAENHASSVLHTLCVCVCVSVGLSGGRCVDAETVLLRSQGR